MQCNDFRELNIHYSFYFDHFPVILCVRFFLFMIAFKLKYRLPATLRLSKGILQLKRTFYMLLSR